MNTIPYLSKYRNAEYIQFMKNSIAFAQQANQEPLTEPINLLVTEIEAIETLFLTKKSSVLTLELTNLDNLRDQLVIGVKYVLHGQRYNPNATLAAAAVLLYENIITYGSNITRLGYQEETAVIDNLVSDWENNPDLTNAVSSLNLQEWLTKLKEANINFNTVYKNRVIEKADTNPENIASLRTQATKAFKNLLNHIQAHITFNTNEVYAEILERLEVMSAEYNRTVGFRSANNEEEE